MNHTILIIDDMKGVRDVVGNALQKQGYHILSAANGVEALEVLSQNGKKIDLILSDYNMPKMNGFELLLALRNSPNPTLAKKPFILLTSESSLEQRKKAKEHGLNSWIVKPYSFRAFLSEIRYVLEVH